MKIFFCLRLEVQYVFFWSEPVFITIAKVLQKLEGYDRFDIRLHHSALALCEEDASETSKAWAGSLGMHWSCFDLCEPGIATVFLHNVLCGNFKGTLVFYCNGWSWNVHTMLALSV